MNWSRNLRSLSAQSRLIGTIFCADIRFGRRTICQTSAGLSAKTDDTKMEKLEVNPYFEKYAKKIAEIQRTSPEEFLARLEVLKKSPVTTQSQQTSGYRERGFSEVGPPKKLDGSRSTYVKEKTLDSIMKVDLIKDKSAEDISKIWVEYHRNQEKIAAVIPASAYTSIFERAKDCPTFLYPLPREKGYEFIMAQFDGHACHFTSLVNFQAFKEEAPECFAINHFTELQNDKGIVLMTGEYNTDVLSGADALCLANQLKLYYTSQPGETKHKLLTSFTQSPGNFKHMDLIAELQNFAM